MITSPVGIALLKSFEDLKLDSYRDIGGRWTIGWGSTDSAEPDQHITEVEADVLLRNDLQRVEGVLNAAITGPVLQNQFDAFADFAYNLGTGAFAASTLLRLFNRGDIVGCSNQFPLWTHVGGKVIPGLVRRRQAEQDLFLNPTLPGRSPRLMTT